MQQLTPITKCLAKNLALRKLVLNLKVQIQK